MKISVNELHINDYPKAYGLITEVFDEYEAPVFPPRGAESFREFLFGGKIEEMTRDERFSMLYCLADGIPAAACGIRDFNHISLLFVRKEFHRKGIGRLLVSDMEKISRVHNFKCLTVNSSPYGLPFYKAMGFKATGMETMADGIIYTPMSKLLN